MLNTCSPSVEHMPNTYSTDGNHAPNTCSTNDELSYCNAETMLDHRSAESVSKSKVNLNDDTDLLNYNSTVADNLKEGVGGTRKQEIKNIYLNL